MYMKRIVTFSTTLVVIFNFLIFLTPVQVAAYVTINADFVLAFTNAERYWEGLPILSTNNKLSEVAKEKMVDMFTRQYFEHVSPTGESVSDLAKGVGYEYITVGENLALGDFASSKAVVDAWMDSEGHRRNILSENYSEIGIAAGRGMYQGRNTWIIVQSFGLPKSTCPAIDNDLQDELEIYEERLEIYQRVANMRKEAAEDEEVSYATRVARVEAYNIVARLYNSTAEKYRDLIDEYNEEAGEFNECMRGYIDDIETH